MRTCSEERRQVTIIYFEISRLIVPDEFKGKWRVKAGNSEFTLERNQDAGAFEEPLVRVTETETRNGWNNLRERKIYSCFGFGLSAELKPGGEHLDGLTAVALRGAEMDLCIISKKICKEMPK